jgi:hypothetical protein
VLRQQPSIKVHRPWPKTRPFGDPYAGVVTEIDLGSGGISPVTTSELNLDKRQEAIGVALALEGLRSVFAQSIEAQIAGLISARRQPPDVAETAMAGPVPLRHHATGRI